MKRIIPYLKRFLFNYPEGGAILGLVVIFVAFSVFTKGFFTVESFISILTVASLYGMVALAVTLLMISGEFDLSVGSIWGFSCVLVPFLITFGIPAWISVILTIIICLFFGFLQGLIVVKIGIPSFIVTMAGMMCWRALGYVITGGSYVNVPKVSFFKIFSYKFANGINVSSIWFIGIAIISILVLSRTRFGNWIFATGGNKLAAIQSGIPIDRVKLLLFSLSAGMAGFAGIIQITQFSIATYQYGYQAELFAITIAVIGGNRLSGGYGTLIGTVLGSIVYAMIQNGLVLAQVSGYWFKVIVGIMILIAVTINSFTQRRALGLAR